MKERTAIEDKSGSAALGRKDSSSAAQGESYLDKMAICLMTAPGPMRSTQAPIPFLKTDGGRETQCGVVWCGGTGFRATQTGALAGPLGVT